MQNSNYSSKKNVEELGYKTISIEETMIDTIKWLEKNK